MRTKIFMACLVLTGLSTACGRLNSRNQNHSKLEKPEYQIAKQGFYLNEGAFNKGFTGTIIFWADDPSVDAMAAVAKASSSLIRNGVKQLQYLDKNIVPLKREFDVVYKDVEAKKTALFMKSYEKGLYAAATWFSGTNMNGGKVAEVATVLGRDHQDALSPDEIGLLKINLGSYCEAKIWERAVRSSLIHEKYRGRRPTPSGLCEGFYSQQGLLLTTSDLCKADTSYKNYFGCLWHEGVKKTTLWKSRYPDGSEAAVKLSSLSDADLINLFGKMNKGNFFLKQSGVLNVPVNAAENAVAIDISFAPQDGAPGVTRLSVDAILKNMEGQGEQTDDALRLFKSTGHPEAAQAYLNAQNDAIRSDIGFFGRLGTSEYVNENRFNLAFQQNSDIKGDIVWTPEKKQEAAQRFPAVMIVTSPEIEALQQQIAPLVTQIKAIGGKALIAGRELDQGPACKTNPKTLGCQNKILYEDAQDVVLPKDVSRAVWTGDVKLRKSDNGDLLFSEVKFSKTLPYVSKGCAPLKKFADCPTFDDRSSEVGEGVLDFDSRTGLVRIEVPIVDIERQGLTFSARENYRSKLSFSEFSQGELVGGRVVIKASVSLVDDILYTFIGDAAVEQYSDKDQKWQAIAHGGLKMRDEAPTQAIEARQLSEKLMELKSQL